MATDPPHVFGFAGASGKPGDKIPVARSGVAHFVSLADPATQVAIRHIDRLWLGSELQQRRAEGKVPQDILLRRVLVMLPAAAPSRVLINDEVEYEALAQFRYSESVPKAPGTILPTDEFEDICDVRLPQVPPDSGFLLLLCERSTGCIGFDFTPCYPDVQTDMPIADIRRNVLRNLANALAESIFGACFKQPDAVRQGMLQDGWWPALCLLPQTFNSMAEAYAAGDPQGAASIAEAYITGDRLSVMASHWWSVPEFEERRSLIEQAVSCYLQRWYGAATCALVPCIEGIVASRAKAEGKKGPACGKMADVLPELASDLPSTFVLSTEFEEFRAYLAKHFFRKYRHVVAHGAKLDYGPADFLQIVVALDSLYRRFRLPVRTDVVVKPPEATG